MIFEIFVKFLKFTINVFDRNIIGSYDISCVYSCSQRGVFLVLMKTESQSTRKTLKAGSNFCRAMKFESGRNNFSLDWVSVQPSVAVSPVNAIQ